FHDEGKGQRHRSLDGVPYRADARRRNRSTVDTRKRHHVHGSAAAGLAMRATRLVLLFVLFVFGSFAASGCSRATAKTSPDNPPLDMPAPPPRDVEPIDTETPAPAPLPQEPAKTDINPVDYRTLNADAKNQYDTAKGFIRQANEAIRAKNLLYAKNLADKAAAVAAQLAGR